LVHDLDMGRRAKNKQTAPEPLPIPSDGRPKTPKRKAEDDGQQSSLKKIRSSGSSKGKEVPTNRKKDLTPESLGHGDVQELDLGSDSEPEDEPDDFDGGVDSDSESDDEGPITAANMEARSRKLDAQAARDAQLDLGINQRQGPTDGSDDGDLVTFDLPTAEEREAEKKIGGAELHEVQRRIQDCVRVLTDFKALAAKSR
jgi:hypothetical protein